MTDALDRYLARPDADVRVGVTLYCATEGPCHLCPSRYSGGTCYKLRDGYRALAEELEEAKGMLDGSQ